MPRRWYSALVNFAAAHFLTTNRWWTFLHKTSQFLMLTVYLFTIMFIKLDHVCTSWCENEYFGLHKFYFRWFLKFHTQQKLISFQPRWNNENNGGNIIANFQFQECTTPENPIHLQSALFTHCLLHNICHSIHAQTHTLFGHEKKICFPATRKKLSI